MACHVFRVLAVALLCVSSIATGKISLPIQNIELPSGLNIDLYSSDNLNDAREMCLSGGNNGDATIVYVSTNKAQVEHS